MPIAVIQFLILFISIVLQIFYWTMIAYVILSWFIQRPNVLWNLLGSIVHPLLKPFRWARIGMIDFSPIVALLVLDILANLALQFLSQFLV